MRRIRLVNLALFSLVIATGTATAGPIDSSGPILSIGSLVGCRLVGVREADVQLAFHDELASELVKNYRCTVLNRTRGYDVAVENTLEHLSRIDDLAVRSEELLPADVAIVAHYASSGKGQELEGYVFAAPLNTAGPTNVQHEHFTSPSIAEIPVQLAGAVGRMLNLSAQNPAPAPADTLSPSQRVWLVLPFRVVNGRDKTPQTDSFTSRIEAELASVNGIRLVDRATLSEILREKGMPLVAGKTPPDSRHLADLVNADRIMTGVIANQGSTWRLDMHVVDSRTGLLIAAQFRTLASLNDIANVGATMARQLAEANPSSPIMAGTTSQERRRREAEFFLSDDYLPQGGVLAHADVQAVWNAKVQASEVAYMLVHDDTDFVYQAIRKLADWYVNYYADGFYFELSTPTWRGVRLINTVLLPYEHSEATPFPLILRAEALKSVGQLDEAMRLVDEHCRHYPGVADKRVLLVRAWGEYKRGNAASARTLVKKAVAQYGPDAQTEYLLSKTVPIPAPLPAGPRQEYEKLRTVMNDMGRPWPKAKQLEQFLDLSIACEGPQRTLELLCNPPTTATEMRRAKVVPDYEKTILLYKAKCYEQLGAGAEAVRREVEASASNSASLWRTAAQIRPFPVNRKIYLLPVGDADPNVGMAMIRRIGEFYGAKTGILPRVDIPKDELPNAQEAARYSYTVKTTTFLKGCAIPEDALFLAVLSSRKFARELVNSSGNPALTSHTELESPQQGFEMCVSVMVQAAEAGFRCVYVPRLKLPAFDYLFFPECTNRPCVFSKQPGYQESGLVLPAMCAKCQVDYRQVDFERIHNDLLTTLRRNGANIVNEQNTFASGADVPTRDH